MKNVLYTFLYSSFLLSSPLCTAYCILSHLLFALPTVALFWSLSLYLSYIISDVSYCIQFLPNLFSPLCPASTLSSLSLFLFLSYIIFIFIFSVQRAGFEPVCVQSEWKIKYPTLENYRPHLTTKWMYPVKRYIANYNPEDRLYLVFYYYFIFVFIFYELIYLSIYNFTNLNILKIISSSKELPLLFNISTTTSTFSSTTCRAPLFIFYKSLFHAYTDYVFLLIYRLPIRWIRCSWLAYPIDLNIYLTISSTPPHPNLSQTPHFTSLLTL